MNARIFKQWYDKYLWKITLAEYGKCRCLVLIGWLAPPHIKSMICSCRGRWPPLLHWQGLLGNWRYSPDLCGKSILSRVRGAANRGQELSSKLEENAESQSGPWGCENSLPHPPWQGAWTLGTISTILSRALYHAPKSSSPFPMVYWTEIPRHYWYPSSTPALQSQVWLGQNKVFKNTFCVKARDPKRGVVNRNMTGDCPGQCPFPSTGL